MAADEQPGSRFERSNVVVAEGGAGGQVAPLLGLGLVVMLLLGSLTYWLAGNSPTANSSPVNLGLLATSTAASRSSLAASTTSTSQPATAPANNPLPAQPPLATEELATPPPLATEGAVILRLPPSLTPGPTSTPTPVPTAIIYRDSLTGLEISAEEANLRPLLVMIDNHWDAAPQSGLDHASLVYEALAEGGITRFAAIFDGSSGEVAEIGPVRSSRIYFVEYALPYSPLYVHAGGSPAALDYLTNPAHDLLNLDLLEAGPSWRSTARLAPHNLYAKSSSLRAYLSQQQLSSPSPLQTAGWQHKADQPPATPPVSTTISFSFSDANRSDVLWKYDFATNRYLRSQWGGPHSDLISGEQLTAHNVAILFATTAPLIGDEKLRIEVATSGEGDALFAIDGQLRLGKWQKPGQSDPLTFTYADGSPVAFNRGNTWVEVLPSSRKVLFK